MHFLCQGFFGNRASQLPPLKSTRVDAEEANSPRAASHVPSHSFCACYARYSYGRITGRPYVWMVKMRSLFKHLYPSLILLLLFWYWILIVLFYKAQPTKCSDTHQLIIEQLQLSVLYFRYFRKKSAKTDLSFREWTLITCSSEERCSPSWYIHPLCLRASRDLFVPSFAHQNRVNEAIFNLWISRCTASPTERIQDINDKGNVAFYFIPNSFKVEILQAIAAVAIKHRQIEN